MGSLIEKQNKKFAVYWMLLYQSHKVLVQAGEKRYCHA
jgi:hypothetical protein